MQRRLGWREREVVMGAHAAAQVVAPAGAARAASTIYPSRVPPRAIGIGVGSIKAGALARALVTVTVHVGVGVMAARRALSARSGPGGS